MTPEIANAPARDEDRAAFMRLASEHYENFPVGSFLVPARVRPHIHRIYAFARTADDLADELQDAELLAGFGASFEAHLRREADPEVRLFADLRETIEEYGLPERLFFDLLDAFSQDLRVSRYDEAGLLDYCRRSADPVGRLVLRVFGHDDRQLDRSSDAICTGLQLLNHLQDIGADLRDRDRIYLPQEDLVRFGVAEDDLRAAAASSNVRALVRHWTDRTAAMLRAGWPLTRAVGGRLRLELRAIVSGAAAVIVAIRRRDHDVLANRIRLGRARKLATLSRALLLPGMPRGIR